MKSKKIFHHSRLWFSSAILQILFTIILSSACSSDEDSIVNPPEDDATKLSGAISNYPGGIVIVKVKLEIFSPVDSFFVGVDTVDNNGLLNMSLATPPSNFLLPITYFLSPTINVSDSTAKFINFRIVNVYNFSNEQIAVVVKKNFADSVMPGSFFVERFFTTKALTITGADTNIIGNYTSIIKFNLNLSAGWNTVTVKIVNITSNFQEGEYTNGEISGAAWYYDSFTSAMDRPKILLFTIEHFQSYLSLLLKKNKNIIRD
jgi:hypothetical protein